jgi:sodium/hydrogen antiporter
VGLLLIGMALTGSVLKRLPLTASMFYLLAGHLLGPAGASLIPFSTLRNYHFIERMTELAVIVSLFTAGLKLRLPLRDRRWRLALRLATVSMALTVGLIALIGHYLLGLPPGEAVLLGAILAPTDPVLASDVQVTDPGDKDDLRYTLTGEAGLNDGTAFPFVLLGLGLMGARDLGAWNWRWVTFDLIWAASVGLGVGALLGTAVGRFVLYLRRTHKEAVGLDDFLALGLIALSYGAALLLHGYGFLAVFAAGFALRREERISCRDGETPNAADALRAEGQEAATDPERASAFLAQAVLSFNEQLERIGEVAVMLVIGAMVGVYVTSWHALGLTLALFFVIRPLSVSAGLIGTSVKPIRKTLMGWFGVRGIGSIYYLAYAANHGLSPPSTEALTSLTLSVVLASVIVHGISVTPLMKLYQSRR